MTTVVPGRRTRRQSELLDRLLVLFLEQGFSRFTLDDLAAELRCSKTTLYALAPSRTVLDDVATVAPARSVYERNTRIAAERVRSLIEDGINNKMFRQVDIAFAAEMIAHTMQAIQRGDIARRTGLNDAEAYRELASFVLHSLRLD